jgi:hypothetical protein
VVELRGEGTGLTQHCGHVLHVLEAEARAHVDDAASCPVAVLLATFALSRPAGAGAQQASAV